VKLTTNQLATDAGQRAITEHLAALRGSDVAQMVTFIWWNEGEELARYVAPAHLPFDVPAPPPGTTHLSIEERIL
jgi:hypothetical protein